MVSGYKPKSPAYPCPLPTRDEVQWIEVQTLGSTGVRRIPLRQAKSQWALDYEEALRELGVPEERW